MYKPCSKIDNCQNEERLLTEIRDMLLEFLATCITGGVPLEIAEIRAKDILAKVKQHYKQERLDRPELREKIDALLTHLGAKYDGASHPKLLIKAHRDEILALIPDIEEAYKKGRYDALEDNTKAIMEEAKKQERERVLAIMGKHNKSVWGGFSGDIPPLEWQALKEER